MVQYLGIEGLRTLITKVKEWVQSEAKAFSAKTADSATKATNADIATKLGTQSVGNATTPIYLAAGVPKPGTPPTSYKPAGTTSQVLLGDGSAKAITELGKVASAAASDTATKATNADVATKLTTGTVGDVNHPIYIASGVPTKANRSTQLLWVETSMPAYTDSSNANVKFRGDLATIKKEAGVSEVLVGDTIIRSGSRFLEVLKVDATYVYCGQIITPDVISPVSIAKGGTGKTTRAEAFQALGYLGENPVKTTTDDTQAKWKAIGTGYARTTALNELNGQPDQYGLLINIVTGNDVTQFWRTQPSGAFYYRGANVNTTNMPTWTALVPTVGSVGKLNTNSSTTQYLRGDGTWQTPPNTTYGTVSKSAAGLCPALPSNPNV